MLSLVLMQLCHWGPPNGWGGGNQEAFSGKPHGVLWVSFNLHQLCSWCTFKESKQATRAEPRGIGFDMHICCWDPTPLDQFLPPAALIPPRLTSFAILMGAEQLWELLPHVLFYSPFAAAAQQWLGFCAAVKQVALLDCEFQQHSQPIRVGCQPLCLLSGFLCCLFTVNCVLLFIFLFLIIVETRGKALPMMLPWNPSSVALGHWLLVAGEL